MSEDLAQRGEAEIATDLVRRIQSGDAAAEGELVERYSRGLLFMLRRTTADLSLADDLHQEAFRVVLERLRASGLEDPRWLAGFLHRTGRNLFIAEYRRKVRRKTDDGLDGVARRTADEGPGQLSEVLLEEEAGLVRRLIGELRSDRDRQILYRFYIAEDDKQRICADLELSSLHFNRVLFRARQRLKNLLEGVG